MDKKIPAGVKVISVFYYIGAVFGIIFGLLFIFGGGAISNLIPSLGILGAGLFIGLGILLIGLSVLAFFIARGLGKAQKWSRIIVIIFAGIGLIFATVQLIQLNLLNRIINLVINGVIGSYLIFNKEVKKFFH
jgi:hypothetical protein